MKCSFQFKSKKRFHFFLSFLFFDINDSFHFCIAFLLSFVDFDVFFFNDFIETRERKVIKSTLNPDCKEIINANAKKKKILKTK